MSNPTMAELHHIPQDAWDELLARLRPCIRATQLHHEIAGEVAEELLERFVPRVWSILQERIDQPIREINTMVEKLFAYVDARSAGSATPDNAPIADMPETAALVDAARELRSVYRDMDESAVPTADVKHVERTFDEVLDRWLSATADAAVGPGADTSEGGTPRDTPHPQGRGDRAGSHPDKSGEFATPEAERGSALDVSTPDAGPVTTTLTCTRHGHENCIRCFPPPTRAQVQSRSADDVTPTATTTYQNMVEKAAGVLDEFRAGPDDTSEDWVDYILTQAGVPELLDRPCHSATPDKDLYRAAAAVHEFIMNHDPHYIDSRDVAEWFELLKAAVSRERAR